MVHGTVAEGFEGVREAFEANFTQRGEVGAAFAVHRHGEVVVDLWAGTADRETGRAWERDTRGIVFSVTKGLVAMRFLQLLDQGLFDPDAPIAETWPEFGVRGKQTITGRMVLNHRAGLSAVDAPITTWDFADAPDKVHDALVQQRPMWVPGSAQGYAATTYGAYTNEMLERLTGQRFSEALAEHIAAPLGLALASGVPEDEAGEVATLIPVGPKDVLRRHLPTALTRRTHEGRLFRRLLNRSTDARRAFQHPRMSFGDVNKPGHLALDLPWMGVVSSAHDISRAYAGLLGHIDGVNLVSPKTLEKVFPRQSWSQRDRVLQKPLGWSLGFLKEQPELFSRQLSSFGHAGAGGGLGWAIPELGVSMGYVMNRMDWRIRSPRAVALTRALDKALLG